MKIYFEQKQWANETNVWITAEDKNGNLHTVKPMEMIFESHEPSKQTGPSLRFSGHFSREFFPAFQEAIIEAGYSVKKPDVEALKNHLEDMRKLVFEAKT